MGSVMNQKRLRVSLESRKFLVEIESVGKRPSMGVLFVVGKILLLLFVVGKMLLLCCTDQHSVDPYTVQNCATLPGFSYVLRTVLTNSPNSCPPESLFSIINSTYNYDQKRSHTDYIELSMQSQFNKRTM
jgi:hypothetical protein